MTNKEILEEVTATCYGVIASSRRKNDAVAKDGIRYEPGAFHPERLDLKRYWIVLRFLKEHGFLETVLCREISRLSDAVNDTQRFKKLLALIVATLYAVDTPEAIGIAERLFRHVDVQ